MFEINKRKALENYAGKKLIWRCAQIFIKWVFFKNQLELQFKLESKNRNDSDKEAGRV